MVRLIDLGLEKLHELLDRMIEETIMTMNELLNLKTINVSRLDEISKRIRSIKDEVHDLVMEIIIRYQPVASDLRDLKSALEISYGLYRITRYIRDIVYTIADSKVDFSQCKEAEIERVMKIVKNMLTHTLRAYKDRDEKLAREVIEMDKEVDEAFRRYFNKALSSGKTCDIINLLILRSLERLADHCVYIAESTLFVLGKRSV
ncbi:MAG: PhoU domain-containing protein [Sulfolobaceae archaeon]